MRSIGVTDPLVYTKDFDDGTDQLLAVLAKHGMLHHIVQKMLQGISSQWQALKAAWSQALYRRFCQPMPSSPMARKNLRFGPISFYTFHSSSGCWRRRGVWRLLRVVTLAGAYRSAARVGVSSRNKSTHGARMGGGGALEISRGAVRAWRVLWPGGTNICSIGGGFDISSEKNT